MNTTPSGLQFIDSIVGEGDAATAGQFVTVHYTGWLFEDGVQGAKFDSSRDRNDPFEFSLGAGMVIKGWDEGVQGMQIGGQRTLIIPPELGYGARGAGGVIPPNATLKFDVELIAVD
jgi:FKBP-type peptidyl-prolyl cis-trans isomerase FkpA